MSVEKLSRDWQLRLAKTDDVGQLEALIPRSARSLQASCYSPAQIEAALGPIFGVDRQLIADGTYFVAERDDEILGCGGWSRRKSQFGGNAVRTQADALLDPATTAARVRAFFVSPEWARQGIGRAIMSACEEAIRAAGFRRVEIVATLVGEPLYRAFSYSVAERYDIPMKDELVLPVVRMIKNF